MQIGVSGHTVCLLLLRNQSLKIQLRTEQNTENRHVTQAASNTPQVSKIITCEEINTGTLTVLEIKADLVPKEYHNLPRSALAYRPVSQLGKNGGLP